MPVEHTEAGPEGPMGEERSVYFSVVIPTYNRAHLLGRALRSIQAQTFRDFEVIVVDDGSEDDPTAVVAELADSRFRIVRQTNAGAAAARNHGAGLAKGEYLTFLDSDDEALPHWLKSFDHAFRVEGADIVCCGLEKVGVGREVEERGGVLLPKDMGPMFDHIVARFTNGGSFATRREIFEAVGGYAASLRSGQHTELAMRVLPLVKERSWKVRSIMEPLIRVHVHGGPRIRGNPRGIYAGSTYVLRHHGELFRKDPVKHARYHGVAGVNAARIGLFREARHHFREAVRVNPRVLTAWWRMGLAHVPGFMRLRWYEPVRSVSEKDVTGPELTV